MSTFRTTRRPRRWRRLTDLQRRALDTGPHCPIARPPVEAEHRAGDPARDPSQTQSTERRERVPLYGRSLGKCVNGRNYRLWSAQHDRVDRARSQVGILRVQPDPKHILVVIHASEALEHIVEVDYQVARFRANPLLVMAPPRGLR